MPKPHIHKYKAIILGGEKIVRTKKEVGYGYDKKIVKTGGTQVFKCVVPGCAHYVLKELALARECICWNCDKPMILTSENLSLQKPRHYTCRKGATQEGPDTLNDLADLLKG